MIPSSRLLVLGLSVLMLAACGSREPAGEPNPPGAPASASPSASPSRPITTLRGTVAKGVEAGCTVLTSGDRVYELSGPSVRSLRPGEVTVRGYVVEGMMSICQQGTAFRVVEVVSG